VTVNLAVTWLCLIQANASLRFTVLLCLKRGPRGVCADPQSAGNRYNIGWGRRWGFYVMAAFVVFAAIAIPLVRPLHFIRFGSAVADVALAPFLSIAILFSRAWPEEFLFRGLLQNMLSRSSRATWPMVDGIGSVRISHITNMGFPNWRYVFLASVAGIFYGWTWRKRIRYSLPGRSCAGRYYLALFLSHILTRSAEIR